MGLIQGVIRGPPGTAVSTWQEIPVSLGSFFRGSEKGHRAGRLPRVRNVRFSGSRAQTKRAGPDFFRSLACLVGRDTKPIVTSGLARFVRMHGLENRVFAPTPNQTMFEPAKAERWISITTRRRSDQKGTSSNPAHGGVKATLDGGLACSVRSHEVETSNSLPPLYGVRGWRERGTPSFGRTRRDWSDLKGTSESPVPGDLEPVPASGNRRSVRPQERENLDFGPFCVLLVFWLFFRSCARTRRLGPHLKAGSESPTNRCSKATLNSGLPRLVLAQERENLTAQGAWGEGVAGRGVNFF